MQPKLFVKFLIAILLTIVPISANAVNWPLKISASGNYLEDQDGVPFLVIADTAWSLAGELSETEVSTYLDDRQSKGYTAILVSAIEHTFSSNPPYNYNDEHPFTNGSSDWSIRNEAYWTHVDYILNQAKNRGILVFLLPAYLGYQCGSQGWCVEMRAQTNATMTNYGAWLGNRYSDQGNIIWVHGGDADADQYSNAYDRVAAIANGIKAATSNYLHTAHSGPEKSAMDDYNALIDLNTAYSYGAPDSEIRTEYQRTGAKPLMFIEGYYENEHSSTIGTWQSQAMTAYLGGALLGQFFGNCPIWHFGSNSNWCGSTNWEGNLDSNGSKSIGYIGKLMRSRKWNELEPDYSNSVVTSRKGTGLSYHATARTTDGETIMVWCPNTNQVTVDMSKISGAQAKCWWYNPASGSAIEIGTYATAGSRQFTPPPNGGWVLVIDDTSLSLPAPGYLSVNPTDNPPTVFITNPLDGSEISGSVMISADATDDAGISKVEFYVDGNLVGSDNTTPYEIFWDTLTVSDGTHIIRATAIDTVSSTSSDSVSVNIENINDFLVINSTPGTVATVGLLYTYDVEAVDSDAGDTLRYSLTSGPADMTIDSTTGFIAWTPVSSDVGDIDVEVTVEDQRGLQDAQSFTITVSEAPTDLVVFTDSFETGLGNWGQDPQNDWLLSTQRAGDGTYSAEVNGPATDAQLISVPIDLQGRTNAIITFAWYIESGLDTGEYLAFDVSADGGFTWTEKARLSGNVDQENVWHEVSVELTGLDNLRLRFRGKMSRFSEYAVIDGVSVAATWAGLPTDNPPTVFITNPLDGSEISGSVMISADATDDAGISKVEFYVDGNLVGSDNTTPYEILWDTLTVSDGTHIIRATAIDTVSSTSSDSVSVNIENINDFLVINSTPGTVATVGLLYTYDVEAVDSDARDILRYSLTSGPADMTIDSTTGFIAWTPISSDVGDIDVEVTVEDQGGLQDAQSFTITVSEAPTDLVVFADSFETGLGNWGQDAQNDWLLSTQRAGDGTYSAEVNGPATDAQLISVPIDLQGRTNAIITFAWYIESGLDTGEYLAFDVSADGGFTWTEKARLSGNVDQENVWHEVSVELTGLDNLRLRFRGKMSRFSEYAVIDGVSVAATWAGLPTDNPPTVSITNPLDGSEMSGSVMISADATDDAGISKVEFYVDGNLVGSDNTTPYEILWDTLTVSDGTYTISAITVDTGGNTAYSPDLTVEVANKLSSGLVAAFGFNYVDNALADSSGNGNHGSCTEGLNCPMYVPTGGHLGSGAFDFAGSGNHIEIANEDQFDFNTNFTVSLWMKVNRFSSGSWEGLVMKGDSSWGVSRYQSSRNVSFTTFSPAPDDLQGTAIVDDNQWHHVAITYDGNQKRLYVDGQQDAVRTYTDSLSTNNLKVRLGYNEEYPRADYSGFLDDVRMYNRALSQTEIQNIMSSPVAP